MHPRNLTLREYIHRNGLRGRPRCFYCGLCATTLDHTKPHCAKGQTDWRNLVPACHRCNMRKGPLTLKAFRARVRSLWAERFGDVPTGTFFSDGVTGGDLRRLRSLLKKTTRTRTGKLRVLAPGEKLSRPRSEVQRQRDRERPRWRGRLTMTGGKAVAALAAETGASPMVIERFVLGLPVIPAKKLKAAARKLRLNIEKLRELRPVGRPPPKREVRPKQPAPTLVPL